MYAFDPNLRRAADARLPGKGNSNSHGTRPVHLIITMITWIWTSGLSIKNSLSAVCGAVSGSWFVVRDLVRGVWGLGFRVQGAGFELKGFGFGFRFWGFGYGVWGFGVWVPGSGCRVYVERIRARVWWAGVAVSGFDRLPKRGNDRFTQKGSDPC